MPEQRYAESNLPFLYRTFIYRLGRLVVETLDYNQLKIRVLSLFKGPQELASDDIRAFLTEQKVALSDKAMKMALMRYTRQGLLSRTKKTGHYCYRLTEKGDARRAWLTKSK